MSPNEQASQPLLATDRLLLRPLASHDDAVIFALRSNAEVNRYLGRKPAERIEDAQAFIEMIQANTRTRETYYWAIDCKETGQMIGTIGLFQFAEDGSGAEIGYELLPHNQGKGFMREALGSVIAFGIQALGLRELHAYTHAQNDRSSKLLQELHFQLEAEADDELLHFRLVNVNVN
ncbi:MAG: N-acetyltransferase [Chitinophagaceae bacterium]|nr:MAG: N-acetyltransferase [Chitinophagaceae bacterium]